MQLEIIVARPAGAVIDEQDGAIGAGEVPLQRENLATVAQRIAREHADLRERIEDDALRLDGIHLFEDGIDRVGELDLGGMKDGVLVLGSEIVLGRNHFSDMDIFNRPVRARRDVALKFPHATQRE